MLFRPETLEKRQRTQCWKGNTAKTRRATESKSSNRNCHPSWQSTHSHCLEGSSGKESPWFPALACRFKLTNRRPRRVHSRPTCPIYSHSSFRNFAQSIIAIVRESRCPLPAAGHSELKWIVTVHENTLLIRVCTQERRQQQHSESACLAPVRQTSIALSTWHIYSVQISGKIANYDQLAGVQASINGPRW